ncbi:MAG: protein kinase [Deltaproteobacteria bacterium]|nr:protein kinase [Deltaproteobacteria bacterium]
MTSTSDTSSADGDSLEPELRELLHAPAVDPEAFLRQTQPARLMPGTVIDGTFVVQQRLGQGGMGIVYRARHEALGRDVAIKLCRRRANDEQTARLAQEAHDTAALAHPNIVVVHHVGTMDDQVYVVMEHVGGGTLRQWLRAQPRTWRAIVAKLVQAAQGLAAAHEKGFVHRDFKPDNVLIGEDGRARVSDFGLAITMATEADSRPTGSASGERSGGTRSTMHTAGTPRYMAPEQFSGDGVSAASDQFALCVALYEALSGEHPFVGGRSEPPATRRPDALPRRIPGRVRRALDRGLALDASARHRSIPELIERLTAEPRWARWMGLLVVGATGGMFMLAQPTPDPCAEPLLVGPTWNEAAKEALRARFAASTLGAADALAARVEGALDDHVAQWWRSEAEVCRRTTNDARAREARHACLLERMVEIDSLYALVADGEAEVLARSLGAVTQLPSPTACSNDPLDRIARRAPVDHSQINEHLARASTAVSARKLDLAMSYADAALEAAVDAHGRARARMMRYRVFDKQSRHADALAEGERALQLAIRAGADDVAAEATTLLVFTTTAGLGKPETAEVWAQRAEAWLARVGEPAVYRVTLDAYRGLVLRDLRRFEQAEVLLVATLAAVRALEPPRPELLISVQIDLASTLQRSGKLDEAQAQLHEALTGVERDLGADHPVRLLVLQMLSAMLMRAGRHEQGLARAEEVLAGYLALYGPDSPRTAAGHVNVGANLINLLRLDQARESMRNALAIYERVEDRNGQQVAVRNLSQIAIARQALDEAEALARRDVELSLVIERKPNVVVALSNLGNIQSMRKHHEAAYATAQRVVELAREAYGTDDPQQIYAWALLGDSAREVGQLETSRRAFGRGFELLRTTGGREQPMWSYLVVGLAYTEARSGRHTEAVALLEGVDVERIQLHTDRYAAMQALAVSKLELGDRAGAREAADLALEHAQAGGHPEDIAAAQALVLRLSKARGRGW